MKTALLFTLLQLAAVPTWGGTITMDFSVNMDWRYDLATNAMDPTFQPLAMNVQAIIDDERTGSIFFPPETTRILFGDVSITSPLSGLVNMGYDVSTLTTQYSNVNVQDTFITDTNQGTWTVLDEKFVGNDAILERDLQFTDDPRLTDPANFGSADLRSLLASHLGKQYQYREDIVFPGGGFQHHGVATVTNITFDSIVPEPPTGFMMLGALALILGAYKRPARRRF